MILPPPTRRLSALLVVFSGLLLSLFAGRTWVNPIPPDYPLEWGRAQWIETATESPNGYFRKTIWLDEVPRRAWLQIAGTDNLTIFLNGQPVGQTQFYSDSVATSGFYDLTLGLVAGRNVIAVEIARLSFPGRAGLIARLGIEDSKPGEQEYLSDGTWRVQTVPKGITSGLPWRALVLDDTSWPLAHVAGPPKLAIQRVPVQPQIFTSPVSGLWLTGVQVPEKEFRYRYDFTTPPGASDTWIEVGSYGDYELSINGKLVCDRSTAANTLDLICLKQWVHPGVNRLSVRVRQLLGIPALFMHGVTVAANGDVTTFSTDESWKLMTKDGPVERPAIIEGRYGDQPFGWWQKQPPILDVMPGEELRILGGWLATILGVTGGLWLFWRATGLFGGGEEALRADALAHLPMIGCALILLLVSSDMRWANDCCFGAKRVWALAGVLLAGKLLVMASRFLFGRVRSWRGWPAPPRGIWLPGLLLILITLAGLVPRVAHLTDISLDHDEMSLVQMARAIPHDGYPHALIGAQNRNQTTYEAATYPIALFGAVTGWTEAGVRIPAVIFGALTVLLMGIWGWRWFGPSVGLLSALVFAFLPSTLEWSRNAFWPQQTQFFGLLTVGFFYEAARGQKIDHHKMMIACIGLPLTYLSWEGAGFLLPALCIAFVVLRWPDHSWLKDLRLWACFIAVAAVIASQLSYRQINMYPYMMVGPGLSDLKAPSLFLLNAMFDPLFYWANFLHPENHYPFTLLAFVGTFLFWRNPTMRYLVLVLLLLLISYTAFLSVYAVRYAHWFLPLLILPGVYTAVEIWRRVASLIRSLPEALLAHGFMAVLIFTLWAVSAGAGLAPYRLNSTPPIPVFRARSHIYQFDYRSASRFVRDNLEPGDIVIPAFPHIYQYYSGSYGDYFMTTLLAKRTMYEATGEMPRYTDRFGGNAVLRDITETQDVMDHATRVWIVSVPNGVFNEFNDPLLPKFLYERGEVVYESYSAEIYLCRGVSRNREGVFVPVSGPLPIPPPRDVR